MNKKSPFLKFAEKVLICSFVLFIVGSTFLNSYESTINAETKTIKNEIQVMESDIDGLTMKQQDLASFSRVSEIANKNGYTYKQDAVSASVVGVQRN